MMLHVRNPSQEAPWEGVDPPMVTIELVVDDRPRYKVSRVPCIGESLVFSADFSDIGYRVTHVVHRLNPVEGGVAATLYVQRN